MCLEKLLENASPELKKLQSDISTIVSNLKFMIVAYGVILPIIIICGTVFNVMCLRVLCRKALRSAPFCLLQSLTVCDILIMLFSIYSDVEPAIRSSFKVDQITGNLFPNCHMLESLRLQGVHSNATNANARFVHQVSLNGSRRAESNIGNGTANLDDMSDEVLLLLLQRLMSQKKDKPPVFTWKKTKISVLKEPNSLNSSSWKQRFYDVQTTPSSVKRTAATTAAKSATATAQLETSSEYAEDQFQRGGNDSEESSPLSGVRINTRPILQAAERWFAYILMTFNLSITLTLAAERCLAIRCPFRVRTLLTTRRTWAVIVALMVATLIVHTPQFLKEVVKAVESPGSLQGDFQGEMLQSFRRDYEHFVVYITSIMLVAVLGLNVVLLTLLASYKSKIKRNEQAGNKQNLDVNITVTIVVLVFLQLPHNIAMNVLANLSLQGFATNMTLFTRAVVTVRMLYVTNSAFNCITYCILSRRFRSQFLRVYCCCSCFARFVCRRDAHDGQLGRQLATGTTAAMTTTTTTGSVWRLSRASLSKSRSSLSSLNKSQLNLNALLPEKELRALIHQSKGNDA